MGVGKTTVARRMARDMGVACVDVDAFLERKHGKSAAELFGEFGEDVLRELEYEASSNARIWGIPLSRAAKASSLSTRVESF